MGGGGSQESVFAALKNSDTCGKLQVSYGLEYMLVLNHN